MEIKIIKTESVNWRDIEPLQPDNFKQFTPEQYKKLKTSLVKNGFSAPFYVWETEGKLMCLDGYHRIKAMKDLDDEGHAIPVMLPANFIHCKDKKDAKKLVLIYNSSYAKINKDSFYGFVSDFVLSDLKCEIDIPELSECLKLAGQSFLGSNFSTGLESNFNQDNQIQDDPSNVSIGSETISQNQDVIKNKTPVTFIFDDEEFAQWEQAKDKIKIQNDKNAILKIIGDYLK